MIGVDCIKTDDCHPGNNLNGLTKNANKVHLSLTDFKFYKNEKREIVNIDLSPCRSYMSICDSFGIIYIYQFYGKDFIFLLKTDLSDNKGTIKSIVWISKKCNIKKHMYLHNKLEDYLLIVTTRSGCIHIYDLKLKMIIHTAHTSGSISSCRLDNSLQNIGLTTLNGYFYLYNLYKNETNIIYNCFDKFYDETVRDNTILSHDEYEGRNNNNYENIKMSTDFSTYLLDNVEKDESDEEAIIQNSQEYCNNLTTDFFSKQKKKHEEDLFNIYIKNKFKCKEKLTCFYFVDILKSRKYLLKMFSSKNAHKRRRTMDRDLPKADNEVENEDENDVENEDENEDENGEDSQSDNDPDAGASKSRKRKRSKKKDVHNDVLSIEKAYSNYKHYALIGGAQSKIYKYNMVSKVCEGEYVGINNESIIWDVIYIYRTNEVASVDNNGSLIIFDYKSYSIKYHFNNHTYKATALTKNMNESNLFTTGVDRFVIKYELSFNKNETDISNYTSDESSDSEAEESEEIEEEENTVLQKSLFFISKIKKMKKLNKKWIYINKHSIHMSDIKKIIYLQNNVVITVSDDLTYCLYDTFKNMKKYFLINYYYENNNILFSPNFKTVFCIYSNKVSIHYNIHGASKADTSKVESKELEDGSVTPAGEEEEADCEENCEEDERSEHGIDKLPVSSLTQINERNYSLIANIVYEPNERILEYGMNKSFTKFGCITNIKFCIYYFNINTLELYNYDVSALNFYKVYSFMFLDDNQIVVSLARRCEGESELDNTNNVEETEAKGKANKNKKNINESLKYFENNFSYHLCIYNVEKKKIIEEIEVDRIFYNFKKCNKKLIACSDNMKNIYLFFKDSKCYLNNFTVINDFNTSIQNIYRTYIFLSLVEKFLFIFSSNNTIYVYGINYENKNIFFLKNVKINNCVFSQISQILFLNLNQITKEYNHIQNNEPYNDMQTITSLKYSYCLIFKGYNALTIMGLNLFDNIYIDIEDSYLSNQMKKNNNYFSQYYLSSLKFKYNYLNYKQIYFQDKKLFHMLLDKINMSKQDEKYVTSLSNNETSIATNSKESYKNYKNINQNEYSLDFSLKFIACIHKRNILNMHSLYTSENRIILLACAPTDLAMTLVNVADTKKYIK
ncbi:U3 small nucleolar RNA-associated protein 4, putative [Plasmodium chabaudi chabaudi]|uniref:U3 small nucleolar RNA-associated protein 4, putative n=1 Tax=Plasmodium chabaudi chabaudi TaxID=31271 RepID=A0A1C6XM99_PLACU|nr:U3 small nucleolar RNA-associated protein 4, putative [Plasmodium chabaudi chabaudi]